MLSMGSPKNLSPPWLSICSSPRWMAPTLAALMLPYLVRELGLAFSPTYCSMARRSFRSSSSRPLSSAILNTMLQHAGLGLVQVEHAGQQQRAHVGDGGAHRVALLAEDVPQRGRAGQGLGRGQPALLEASASLPDSWPAWLMPVRSPLTSAMKTGTPMREKLSASVCSVTVLPVPVAPVIRPCRLARPGSRFALGGAIRAISSGSAMVVQK
jgi:hypothetical protein